MKKNHTNLFTPSLFTLSIYEIIYAALFKDYRPYYLTWENVVWSEILIPNKAKMLFQIERRYDIGHALELGWVVIRNYGR